MYVLVFDTIYNPDIWCMNVVKVKYIFVPFTKKPGISVTREMHFFLRSYIPLFIIDIGDIQMCLSLQWIVLQFLYCRPWHAPSAFL